MILNNKIKKAFLFVLALLLVFTVCSCSEIADGKLDGSDKQDINLDIIDPIVIDPTEDEPQIIEPAVIEEEKEETLKVLSNVTYPSTDKDYLSINSEFKSILNKFSKKFTDLIFSDKNEFFSPISLYMACGMLYEGMTDEAMKKEFQSLMGFDSTTASAILKQVYQNNYYSNKYGKTYMANSIWMKNGLAINNSYIDTLKNQYYAVTYQVNFAEKSVKQNIVDWINHNTENLLNLTLDNYEVKDDLALLLLNTIYFNNNWETAFLKNNTKEQDFYITSDNAVKTSFMTHTITSYIKKCDDYLVCQDYFYNGNKITYIMPSSYDLSVLKKFTYEELTSDLKQHSIILEVPSFECFREYNLKDTFIDLGVSKIFDSSLNGFRNITENMYVDYIKQNTGIKLTEEGVEAAAVTSIGNKCTSAGPGEDPYVVSLYHPFMYIISDSNDLPLFVGCCQNPTLKK